MQRVLFLAIFTDTAIPAVPRSGGYMGYLCMHLVHARVDVLHGQNRAVILLITLNGTQTD